ncbi:MAG: type II toxin-antitoxin system antitoxin SocA domain-containing protein [Pseudomonadota bacterium]
MPISQLKLMKLVYIAYGWHLALNEIRLYDEPIYAWEHGPVVRSIYDEFKNFGKRPITRRATEVDWDTFELMEPRVPEDDAETRWVLDRVWATYKDFRAWTLRNKTHEAGGPWDKVYDPKVRDVKLNDDDIREHYVQRISAYIDAAHEFEHAS